MLLKAFRHANLNQVELVLAGQRAWLWKDVVRAVRALRLESCVRLLDYVADDDCLLSCKPRWRSSIPRAWKASDCRCWKRWPRGPPWWSAD